MSLSVHPHVCLISHKLVRFYFTGEVMEIEVLKNLPSLPKQLSKTSQSQPPGLDTSVHKFYEKREFIIRGYMIA